MPLGGDTRSFGPTQPLATTLPLSTEAVRGALRALRVADVRSVQIYGRIDSTNAELLRQARRGAAPVTVCVADTQTRGRGRGGRAWCSPPGRNCYVSVLDHAAREPRLRPRVALWTGIALAEMLRAAGAGDILLKWPNDLLWRGAKLGGVLSEGVVMRGGTPGVVVGVGLNLRLPADQRRALGRPVADLHAVFDGMVPDSRAVWVARVIAAVIRAGELARNAPGELLAERWSAWDALRGCRIRLPDGGITGVARGVDADGRLRVATAEGIRHLTTLEDRWVLKA